MSGAAELTAVKASSTFFATGHFIGEDFAATNAGVRMRHIGRNSIYSEQDYRGGIYRLPVEEAVDADNWRQVRDRRDTYALPPLEVALDIAEVVGGFDLHWRTTGGVDGVPCQIECVFTPSGIFETETALVEGAVGQTAFLKSGYGIYRVGADAILIGPGAFAHAMWKMLNSEVDTGGYRVLIAFMAPVEHTLEIRCGRWSDAADGWSEDYSKRKRRSAQSDRLSLNQALGSSCRTGLLPGRPMLRSSVYASAPARFCHSLLVHGFRTSRRLSPIAGLRHF